MTGTRLVKYYNKDGSLKPKGSIMSKVETSIAKTFVCPKCDHQDAHAERLSMSGTGLSRLVEVQPYRYTFVSCSNCGYTEIYDLKILEGKDNLGTFLEILFAN